MELSSSIQEELVVQAIGEEALGHLKQIWTLEWLAQAVEGQALKVLEDIRRVLNDENSDNPECFRRVQAIVNTLEANGIYTSRHDF